MRSYYNEAGSNMLAIYGVSQKRM